MSRIKNIKSALPEPDVWDSEEFFDLMQQYRHYTACDPPGVKGRFEAVKKFCRTQEAKERERVIFSQWR